MQRAEIEIAGKKIIEREFEEWQWQDSDRKEQSLQITVLIVILVSQELSKEKVE